MFNKKKRESRIKPDFGPINPRIMICLDFCLSRFVFDKGSSGTPTIPWSQDEQQQMIILEDLFGGSWGNVWGVLDAWMTSAQQIFPWQRGDGLIWFLGMFICAALLTTEAISILNSQIYSKSFHKWAKKNDFTRHISRVWRLLLRQANEQKP